MVSPKNDSAIRRYFQTKLVVVEVRDGESQEDAWRRYLAEHPGCSEAHVKIFHYPEPSPLKKERHNAKFPLVSHGKTVA